jgi:hypothetical protein
MDGPSSAPEPGKTPRINRLSFGGKAQGNEQSASEAGADSASGPTLPSLDENITTATVIAEELSQLTELQPWQRVLLAVRAAEFVRAIRPLLDQAGELILFPSESEHFENAKHKWVERYKILRDEYHDLFFSLSDKAAVCSGLLPSILGGGNAKATGASGTMSKVQAVFEGKVFGDLEALAELCERAVKQHREVFAQSVTDRQVESEAELAGVDYEDLLGGGDAEGERAEELLRCDLELLSIVSLCRRLSQPLSNEDEGFASCSLKDFIRGTVASSILIESKVDPSIQIKAKLSGLAVLLRNSSFLMDCLVDNATTDFLINRQGEKICSREELRIVEQISAEPVKLNVERDVICREGKSQGVVTLAVSAPYSEVLKSEYQRVFDALGPYFEALRLDAGAAQVGIAVRRESFEVLLYLFEPDASERAKGAVSSPLGDQQQEDGAIDDEDDAMLMSQRDPRELRLLVTSVLPGYTRALPMQCALAAFSSASAMKNFQAIRRYLHECAEIEQGFAGAQLHCVALSAVAPGDSLRKRHERNILTLILKSRDEQGRDFHREFADHPLWRELVYSAEEEWEGDDSDQDAEGQDREVWGPRISQDDRGSRYLSLAGALWEHEAVRDVVTDLLQEVHPLWLPIEMCGDKPAEGDSPGQLVAAHLGELLEQVRQIRDEYSRGKLYLARLAPEVNYPGFRNITDVYNVYLPDGVLISRLYAKRLNGAGKSTVMERRDLNGKDLLRARQEVLTVLGSCSEDFMFTVTDLKNHFSRRGIHLCDTLLQDLCTRSEDAAKDVVEQFFHSPSLWIEREWDRDERTTKLYVCSQREREDPPQGPQQKAPSSQS